MTERGVGVYEDQDGTILVSFEKGQKGVPLKSLLPKAARGEGFGEFDVAGYFDFAHMVLITPEGVDEMQRNLSACKPGPGGQRTGALPPIDPTGLKLCQTDGSLSPQKTAELFEVVAAYWENKSRMGLEFGLVAGLWRRGMAAKDIVRSIQFSTDKDGKLIKATGRGHDIMNTVIEAYLDQKGLPRTAEISQAEMTDLIDRWLTATRSADLGSNDMQNSVLHWSEYRRLGLLNETGRAQTDQVRLIADKIFKFDTPLTFKQISSWIDHYHPPKTQTTPPAAKAAKVMLRKKRKQGRVNRKRGRR